MNTTRCASDKELETSKVISRSSRCAILAVSMTYYIEKGNFKRTHLKTDPTAPGEENSILHNIEARDFLMIDISGRCENGIIILQVRIMEQAWMQML